MKAKMRKFFALTWHHKMLFLEALVFQLVTGLVLKVVPFRMVPGMYGSRREDVVRSCRSVAEIPTARRDGHAVVRSGIKTFVFKLLSFVFPHRSPFSPHVSSLTSHVSSLTSHVSSLTSHVSSLTSHVSSLTSHVSSLPSIRNAILTSSQLSPWRNRCLVQSLAAKWMLNRRRIPSQLSLGMAKDSRGRLTAHAWLIADGFEVIEKNGDYTELFLF